MTSTMVSNIPEAGLVHVSDEDPGFSRKRAGKGFSFFNTKGGRITDPEIKKRIKNIGIPPNWENVWICALPNGYLQATGIDGKGRKQYLYHDDWVVHQQEFKFNQLKEFGLALPEIRKLTEACLRKKGWPREKVLALVIGILDETYVRIGNKYYYDLYGTHGLTTLRRKNLKTNGKEIVFKYKAKSAKLRKLTIKNPKFIRLIRGCAELRGYEVFRYIDGGKTHPVNSQDVNEFLQEITGQNFTSKNFRTWGGTTLAVKKFPEAKKKFQENKRLKLRNAIVKEVAAELSNTISVCERYYIHPAVLEALDNPDFSAEKFKTNASYSGLSKEEEIVLSIIGNDK